MRNLFIATALFVSAGLGGSQASLTQILQGIVPPQMKLLFMPTLPKSEILKALGPAEKVEKNTYYYSLSQFKYALDVRFRGNRLAHFQYSFPKATYSFSLFTEVLDLSKARREGERTHEGGRYLSFFDAASGLILRFRNNEAKTLDSVEYQEPGRS